MGTLTGISDAGINTAYENVRRIIGDRAAVEVVVDSCVVVRFDGDGAITRMDEYIDSAAIAPLVA